MRVLGGSRVSTKEQATDARFRFLSRRTRIEEYVATRSWELKDPLWSDKTRGAVRDDGTRTEDTGRGVEVACRGVLCQGFEWGPHQAMASKRCEMARELPKEISLAKDGRFGVSIPIPAFL